MNEAKIHRNIIPSCLRYFIKLFTVINKWYQTYYSFQATDCDGKYSLHGMFDIILDLSCFQIIPGDSCLQKFYTVDNNHITK